MKPERPLLPVTLLAAACIGAGFVYAIVGVARLWPGSTVGSKVHSGVPSEILIMRTTGGVLEVTRITANEHFDQTFVYSLLGVDVGETVAHIRVPATYRYHIELAPEWEVYRRGDVFKVITPPVKPSLPVAVDLARMEKDVGGSWYLVAFSDQADLDALEEKITAKLAEKANSAVYRNMQREEARKTVTEFVEKWLVTQQAWKTAERPRVEVVFGG